MTGNGIMEEIRTHLSTGKSSGEVIALGFKPGTVYKVLRGLNRKTQGNAAVSSPAGARPLPTGLDAQARSELEAENIQLHQQVEDLEAQLECVVDADPELEAEVRTLRERVKVLEPEAVAAGQLRLRVRELEGQLERASLTQVTMRQRTDQWRQEFAAEQAARQKLEEWAGKIWPEHQRVQAELAEWQRWLPKAHQTFQVMDAEIEGLRPLQVWAGHPCKKCQMPMSGLVDRETAAKLMHGFGHKACLEKQGSGLGGLLLAGGALAALAQLGKK
jgi:regulator of replication initiation timing